MSTWFLIAGMGGYSALIMLVLRLEARHAAKRLPSTSATIAVAPSTNPLSIQSGTPVTASTL